MNQQVAMKNMRRALRRFNTEVHQRRRLKEDQNQHIIHGGVPHFIDFYLLHPKLQVCGNGYTEDHICPCFYSEKHQARFKSQPQDKLSTRLIGHGWKDWLEDLKEIKSKLKLEEGIKEYESL